MIPEPPDGVKLRAKDKPFWAIIMRARLHSDWADIDLTHAANLARMLADIEAIKAVLAKDGDFTGTPSNRRPHPAHKLISDLTAQSMQLTRMLKLHALISGNSKNTDALGYRKGLATAASAQHKLGLVKSDGLLAQAA